MSHKESKERLVEKIRELKYGMFIEEHIGPVHITATKKLYPMMGVAFGVTLFGPDQEREQLISELKEELGEPYSFGDTPEGIWFYFWKADSD